MTEWASSISPTEMLQSCVATIYAISAGQEERMEAPGVAFQDKRGDCGKSNVVDARKKAHIADRDGGDCISMVGRRVTDGVKGIKNRVRRPETARRLHGAGQITRAKSKLKWLQRNGYLTEREIGRT